MDQTTAKSALKQYKKTVRKKLDIQEIYVFGSYAREDKEANDIDLIIVSEDFEGMNFMDRLVFLSKLRRDKSAKVPMDIIGYTPQEVEELKNSENTYHRQISNEIKHV